MRRALKLGIDICILALALPIGLLLRENFVFDGEKLYNHLPFLVATLLVAVPIFRLLNVDRMIWRYTNIDDHLRIVFAMVLTGLAATVLTFGYNRLDGVSRSVPVLQAMLALLGMVGARIATRRLHGAAGPRPFAPIDRDASRSVLLIGLNGLTELYVKAVAELGDAGVRVAGIVDHSSGLHGMRAHGLPVFGGGRRLEDIVTELALHGVFVERVVSMLPLAHLDDAMRRDIELFSERTRKPVEVFAESMGLASAPAGDVPAVEDAGSEVAFVFGGPELAGIAARPYWRLKRAIDCTLAFVLLATLWPVAILVAIVVALDVGLPVLFWQVRPGLGGRPFALYKFRTMRGPRDHHGRLLTDAERLSPVGRFLRRTRLDELPQLWNILVGEMSFVGPRPLLPVDQSPAFAARLLVRPGLTGWGQIMGGRDIAPADKAALDVWYVRNASLALDLAIVKGTFPMVLRGERVDRAAIDRAWLELRRSGICRRAAPGNGGGLMNDGQPA